MALFNRKKVNPQNVPIGDPINSPLPYVENDDRYVEVASVKIKDENINLSEIAGDDFNNIPLETIEINSYEDAPKIADLLMQYGHVTVSVLRLVRDERVRTLDFLSGIIYATHGRINKVGNRIYSLSIQPHD